MKKRLIEVTRVKEGKVEEEEEVEVEVGVGGQTEVKANQLLTFA